MFRRIGIAHRRSILDLGAGYGSVSGELMRRSTGWAAAFDRSYKSLCEVSDSARLFRIVGDAPRLPFAKASFDLVFCQVGLLWMKPLSKVIAEICRVLQKGGVFLSIEPDYDSMIEYPTEVSTQELWIKTLLRAGGDPHAGRKAPAILESLGFSVRVDLTQSIHPPSPSRFEFLRELPLNRDEMEQLDLIEQRSKQLSGWSQIIHLPFILITAEKK
jgi:ubiquinone/menaquinone biosynthesis C-methylase UbiE